MSDEMDAVDPPTSPFHTCLGLIMVGLGLGDVIRELLKPNPVWVDVFPVGWLVFGFAVLALVLRVTYATGEAFGLRGPAVWTAVPFAAASLWFDGVFGNGCQAVLGVLILLGQDTGPGRWLRRAWNYVAPEQLNVAVVRP